MWLKNRFLGWLCFAVISVSSIPGLAAPAATKIEVSPLPLSPGRSFNIKVTASDVTAGSATVDFRPLSPTILRVTLSLNGGYWTGSGSVPPNLPVGPPTKAIVQATMTKGTARALLSANVPVEKIEPTIKITSPLNLATLNKLQVTVQGTANAIDPVITVNGVPAPLSNGAFSATVGVHEGNNSLTAVLTDLLGKVITTSVPVTVDTEPPRLAIDSPSEGSVLNTPVVTVTGTINDTVVGTVNGNEATVVVNALPAQIANRTFIAANVPLVLGPNVITVIGTDRVGNRGTNKVNVTYKIESSAHIEMVSGNGQSARISEVLANPLIVKAVDDNGNPASGKNVIFKVTQNDGAVISGGSTGASLIVPTGADGRAQVQFKLGTRAGAGNNQVSATIVGFAGEITFQASATPSTPGLLTMDAGNNQVGAVGKPLPNPLATIVVDSGNNRLVGIPITFTVKEGGGSFAGQNTITVNSDSDGRALTVLTLGPDAGNDNNRVEATFTGNTGAPAAFVASGRVPGKTEDTTVSGIVLDNSDVPVPGATLRILGQPTAVQSDQNGYFQIKPAPVGAIRLICDGSTVTRPGKWVWLQFDLVTIAGQDNGIGGPIRLLPINMASAIVVDETHGGTITLPEAPGYSLTVVSNSATYPDGTKSGLVSVTLVHPDKMPDPPSFGQQPRFLVSIQPANTIFNPPAAMCIPNLDGHPPGQKVEMYSYDHDLGRFVSIGTGTISQDGLTLCTDPGSGVVKGGWHCGGNPQQAGSAASLKVDFSSPKYTLAKGTSLPVTASGSPPLDAEYIQWSVDDPSVVVFTSTPSCSDQQSCTATIKALKEGKTKIRVRFRCRTTGQSTTAVSDVIVPKTFAITVTAFIPYEYGQPGIPIGLFGAIFTPQIPLPLLTEVTGKGDARGFSESSSAFRIRQKITVSTDPSLTSPIVSGPFSFINDTHMHIYDPVSGLGAFLFPVSNHFTADSVAATKVDDTTVRVALTATAAPTIDPGLFGDGINWCYNIELKTGPSGSTYSITGGNDNYPSYEVYINGEMIHGDSPAFNNLFFLINGCMDSPVSKINQPLSN